MKKWMVFALFFLTSLYGQEGLISPEKLSKNLKGYLGRSVVFTDELVYIWKKQPLKKAEGDGYIKFETLYLHCLLRQNDLETLKFLKEYLKTLHPHKLVFYGTVIRVNEVGYYVLVHRVSFPKYRRKTKSPLGGV